MAAPNGNSHEQRRRAFHPENVDAVRTAQDLSTILFHKWCAHEITPRDYAKQMVAIWTGVFNETEKRN